MILRNADICPATTSMNHKPERRNDYRSSQLMGRNSCQRIWDHPDGMQTSRAVFILEGEGSHRQIPTQRQNIRRRFRSDVREIVQNGNRNPRQEYARTRAQHPRGCHRPSVDRTRMVDVNSCRTGMRRGGEYVYNTKQQKLFDTVVSTRDGNIVPPSSGSTSAATHSTAPGTLRSSNRRSPSLRS